ncbi:MAG: N-6 DNA methylase [Blastocatellales bacterium]
MEPLTSTATPPGMKQAAIPARQKDDKLAAFYTPQTVAQILTDWALTDPYDTVLDPSYGGCAFLNAAQTTLFKRGSLKPEQQIYGADIDPDAQVYLQDLLAAGATEQQFIGEDFFKLDINSFGGHPFSAVVGNPPYLRYHSIPAALQEQAALRLRDAGMAISGRASYWGYFLLYSTRFLRPGGRLAMLLPGAILHTDYAAQVRNHLTNRFEQVSIYLLQERIFDGTQEESVIVCAEGAGRPNQSVRVGSVSSVNELASALGDVQSQTLVPDGQSGDGGWLRSLLDERTSQLYDELMAGNDVIRLGDWVGTRIGVVTGNNNYFIMSDRAREARGIPEKYFLTVIKRPAYVAGLVATERDLQALKQQGKDCLLLYPPAGLSRTTKALREYLELGEEKGVSAAWKCSVRDPWYVVPHADAPEAFMPVMAASWPRLIVNRSDSTCTNNILKLSWKDRRPTLDWTRLALGTLSTLCQLSAELVGRSYGGGVLKLEPRELAQLAVPLIPPSVTKSLARRVDAFLRQNRTAEATEAVDAVLMSANAQFTSKTLEQLRAARKKLFLRRRQHRRDAEKLAR